MGAGRAKRISLSVCVCRQKTRLFTVLPLENRHKIARFCNSYSSKDAYKVLSSAMAMVSNSCTTDKNITVTGCVPQ